MKHHVFCGYAERQLPGKVDPHLPWFEERQCFRRQRMLTVTGPDTGCHCANAAQSAGMTVGANHCAPG